MLSNTTLRGPLSHDSYVRTVALGHLMAHRSCPGSGLWAVSNFVAFCLDWPLALGPQIHIFCPDWDQGFPAIAGGPISMQTAVAVPAFNQPWPG